MKQPKGHPRHFAKGRIRCDRDDFDKTLPPSQLRNDGIYSLRWGDPYFSREFVRNFPPADKVAGFSMGPDGNCWGREFLSTDATPAPRASS